MSVFRPEDIAALEQEFPSLDVRGVCERIEAQQRAGARFHNALSLARYRLRTDAPAKPATPRLERRTAERRPIDFGTRATPEQAAQHIAEMRRMLGLDQA